MPVPLVIYGAGNPDPVKLIAAANRPAPRWQLLGFIDDTPHKRGQNFMGFPILGGHDHLGRLDLSTVHFYNNVASSSEARRTVSERMIAAGCRFATLIHPSVDTAYVKVAEGTCIASWVHLGANAQIGKHCAVRQLTAIGHDVRVQDHVFIGPLVLVGGRVTVESGAYIGANSTIREDLTVGRNSVVGAGAVVLKDVPPGARVAGVPARLLRSDVNER